MTAEETRHAEFLLSMLASSYLMAAIETQRHNLDCRGAMKYLRDDIRNAIFEFEYPAQVWAPIVAIEQDAANFTSEQLHDLLMKNHELIMRAVVGMKNYPPDPS